MYKVLKKNLEGFEKYFENEERIKLAKPLFLLKNIDLFNNHKFENTFEYQNLYILILKAIELKQTNKYHSFGMLLNELYLQCFDFTAEKPMDIDINADILDYQISLLHQFMFPAYYI